MFAGTDLFTCKRIVLVILCVPSFLFGILWAPLGWRSSCYLDDFHGQAVELEKKIPKALPHPFVGSGVRRKNQKVNLGKLSSSKTLVTFVPLIFAIVFGLLSYFSLTVPLK